jgi:hypothetical protein
MESFFMLAPKGMVIIVGCGVDDQAGCCPSTQPLRVCA